MSDYLWRRLSDFHWRRRWRRQKLPRVKRKLHFTESNPRSMRVCMYLRMCMDARVYVYVRRRFSSELRFLTWIAKLTQRIVNRRQRRIGVMSRSCTKVLCAQVQTYQNWANFAAIFLDQSWEELSFSLAKILKCLEWLVRVTRYIESEKLSENLFAHASKVQMKKNDLNIFFRRANIFIAMSDLIKRYVLFFFCAYFWLCDSAREQRVWRI